MSIGWTFGFKKEQEGRPVSHSNPWRNGVLTDEKKVKKASKSAYDKKRYRDKRKS